MPLEFRCSCGQMLRVPETSVGKHARCPKCNNLTIVSDSLQAMAANQAMLATESPAGALASNPFGDPAGAVANPFGDSAGQTATSPFTPAVFSPAPAKESLNPYASPATAANYHPAFGPSASQRPGLPWEIKRQDFGNWWETARLVMSSPSHAFSIMRLEGGLGQPMMFALWGLAIGFVAQMVWQLPLTALPLMMGSMDQGEVLGQIVGNVVGGAIGVVLGATLGLLINAGITHVMLMLLGGARQPYEATLRVAGYAQGAVAWTNIVPLVGPLIAAIWGIVLAIIGLARAHDISMGKATLAVLLPIVLCVIAVVAIIGGIAAFAIALRA
jgi:hypothetical protein